jgi:hypothetical protein
MNNLFATKNVLYQKAFTKVKSDDVVKTILLNKVSEISPELLESDVKIFLSQDEKTTTLSLCSRNNTLLSVLKMNTMELETHLRDELIDKNILKSNSEFNLKMYHR